jgi:hypothetical protein
VTRRPVATGRDKDCGLAGSRPARLPPPGRCMPGAGRDAGCTSPRPGRRAGPSAGTGRGRRTAASGPESGQPGSEPLAAVASECGWATSPNQTTDESECGRETDLPRFCPLLARDERVHPGLLGCPPEERVHVQQARAEVEERLPQVQLWPSRQPPLLVLTEPPDTYPSRSLAPADCS